MTVDNQSPALRSFAIRLEAYDKKASSTTTGEYLELPLPEDVEEFGWTTDNGSPEPHAFQCELCSRQRQFESRQGGANHLRQVHEKSGHGITDEYLTAVTADETPVASTDDKEGGSTTVSLNLETEVIDGRPIPYLIGRAGQTTRHNLDLRPYSGSHPRLKYSVSLPSEYTEESKSNTPFSGLSSSDPVNVELNLSTNEFRMYHPADYQVRSQQATPEFSAPNALPLLLSLQDNRADLTVATPYDGTTYRILPFIAADKRFIKEALRQDAWDEDASRTRYKWNTSHDRTLTISKEVFDAVVESHDLPKTVNSVAAEINVGWNPKSSASYLREMGLIYQSDGSTEYILRLPNQGKYRINVNTTVNRKRIYQKTGYVVGTSTFDARETQTLHYDARFMPATLESDTCYPTPSSVLSIDYDLYFPLPRDFFSKDHEVQWLPHRLQNIQEMED